MIVQGLLATLAWAGTAYGFSFTDVFERESNPEQRLMETNDRTDKNRTTFVWQGLDHRWNFWPHRISELGSWIDEMDDTSLFGVPAWGAEFHMRQSTGVDGDGMDPNGYYSFIQSDALYTVRGSKVIKWEDNGFTGCLDTGCDPEAWSAGSADVVINLNRESLGYGELDDYRLALRGFDLDVNCDNQDQSSGECVGNGAWFQYFELQIGACTIQVDTLNCPLDVQTGRGWEHDEGGTLIGKAFTEINSYEMTVYWSVYAANDEAISFCDNAAYIDNREFDSDSTGNHTVASCRPDVSDSTDVRTATAITGFSWELFKVDDKEMHDREGRYNRSVGFVSEIPGGGTNSSNEMAAFFEAAYTSSRSGRETRLETMQIAIADPDAIVAGPYEVTGELCIPSTWHSCYGRKVQSEDDVSLLIFTP